MKSRGVLWVKASGTRFEDALRTPIFLPVDLQAARAILLETEDLTDTVLRADGAPTGRPSIETAFHALLPHRYVLHVHSVGAIAASIRSPEAAITRLAPVGEVIAVPYRRPGLPLALTLGDAGVSDLAADRTAVVLLGNHGLLVAAPDLADCEQAVLQVEGLLAEPFDHLLDEVAGERAGWIRGSSVGALSADERDLLRGGALTPDEVVFLGERPFDRADGLAHVDDDGTLWLGERCSHDAAQIARSFIGVARAARGAGPVGYLTAEDIRLLQNWDAEAWRKEQQR